MAEKKMNNRTALASDSSVEPEPWLISGHKRVHRMKHQEPKRLSKEIPNSIVESL